MKLPNLLDGVDHFVVVAFENRSFDHMLGFLYGDRGDPSPLGHPFEGLTGHERNKTRSGEAITIFKLDSADPYCYFTPRADPGEGFSNTSCQSSTTTLRWRSRPPRPPTPALSPTTSTHWRGKRRGRAGTSIQAPRRPESRRRTL